MFYEQKPRSPLQSKTVITGLTTVITGAVMAITGYALPPDAAQLVATGLIGVFLGIRNR